MRNLILILSLSFAAGAATVPELSVQAIEHYRRGNCEAAKPLFEQILAKQPGNLAVKRLLAGCNEQASRPRRRPVPDAAVKAARSTAKPAATPRSDKPSPLAPPPPVPPPVESSPADTERQIAGARLYEAERHIKGGRLQEAERILSDLVADYPDLRTPRLRLAEIYSQTKRFEQAAEQYGHLAGYPDSPSEMRLRQAQNLAWGKKLEPASKSYQQYLEMQPSDSEAWLGLANAQFWGNQLAPSVPTYRSYLRLQPQDNEARLRMARALLWTGNHREALPEFQRLRDSAPNDASIDLAIAQCWEHLDQPERALATIERALAKAPGQKEAVEGRERLIPHTLLRSAYRLQEKGDFRQAADAFRDYLAKKPDDDEALLQIARLESWANDRPGAIRQYQQYLERKPEDFDAWRELAKLQITLPDFDGARKSFGTIVSAGKGTADDYAGLVNSHLWEGHYDAAQPFLERLIELDPEHETARNARRVVIEKNRTQELEAARVLAATGKFSDALQAYRTYTQHFGADRDVELAMARLYAWDSQSGKAVQAYHEYLNRYPDDQEVRIEMADLERWNGKTGAAEREYDLIIREDPKNASARFGLAQIADQRGDDRFAVYNAYQGVLALDPANRTTRRRMAEIAPKVSPSVEFKQSTFQDSDQFSRSVSTVEAGVPFRGGLRLVSLFRYGYFNQFREVSGRPCGSAPDPRVSTPEGRALSEEICSSRGNLRGVGGGFRVELEPNQLVFFHAEASALKFNGGLDRWNPLLSAELVVRPATRTRFTLGFRRRDAVYDVNTISTLYSGITSDTLEASFEMPMSDRWNFWISGGAARYTASRDRLFTDNLQRRITARANYQVTDWMTAGYYVRASNFRSFSPLYFSPEFYGTTGLSWTWDKPLSGGVRFVGDLEIGYGRINRYDTGGVNNLEMSLYPSIVWDIRPDLTLRLGYRFGRGRSSAFGSPVYSTGMLDFGLASAFAPAPPRPNMNRIEIR